MKLPSLSLNRDVVRKIAGAIVIVALVGYFAVDIGLEYRDHILEEARVEARTEGARSVFTAVLQTGAAQWQLTDGRFMRLIEAPAEVEQ